MASPLVSATWLRQQMVNGLRNIRILDASWTMSGGGRTAFLAERLAGAQHFDIDEVADRSPPYPHMVPSPAQFQEQVGKMGVGSADHVVVYDGHSEGAMASPRVWWMFRLFGHERVSVLDGGLGRWKFLWFPTVSGEPQSPVARVFAASLHPHLLRTYQQMMDNHTSHQEQVVDARSSARFKGEAPEPRPSLPSGGMKGAVNLHYSRLLDDKLGTFRRTTDLAKEFQGAGVDMSQAVVATCGSGVTAAHIALAGHTLNTHIPLYDGSWTEWKQRAPPDTVTTGPAQQTYSDS
jgi:thiosulfate/3-mercaptopyruvate sulfurtransferase